jgi:hypothetical protein
MVLAEVRAGAESGSELAVRQQRGSAQLRLLMETRAETGQLQQSVRVALALLRQTVLVAQAVMAVDMGLLV